MTEPPDAPSRSASPSDASAHHHRWKPNRAWPWSKTSSSVRHPPENRPRSSPSADHSWRYRTTADRPICRVAGRAFVNIHGRERVAGQVEVQRREPVFGQSVAGVNDEWPSGGTAPGQTEESAASLAMTSTRSQTASPAPPGSRCTSNGVRATSPAPSLDHAAAEGAVELHDPVGTTRHLLTPGSVRNERSTSRTV